MASADAGHHYQKLYGRVTDVCSNRRGQPNLSAMKEPHPGRIPSMIRILLFNNEKNGLIYVQKVEPWKAFNNEKNGLVFTINRTYIGSREPWKALHVRHAPHGHTCVHLREFNSEFKHHSVCQSSYFTPWYVRNAMHAMRCTRSHARMDVSQTQTQSQGSQNLTISHYHYRREFRLKTSALARRAHKFSSDHRS